MSSESLREDVRNIFTNPRLCLGTLLITVGIASPVVLFPSAPEIALYAATIGMVCGFIAAEVGSHVE